MADQYFLPRESLSVQPSAGLSAVSPDAMGRQVGETLKTVGDVATRIYHDHNATAAMAAQNDLLDWSNEALTHPQTGVLNQESGNRAPKLVDKTLADYRQKTSEIAAKLPNDDARARFDLAAQEHEQQIKRQLYGYEHKQVTDYANRQTGAFLKNSQNAAVAYATLQGPPSAGTGEEMKAGVADEIAKQKAAIFDACQRNGEPPEECARQQAMATSETQMLVLEQFIASGQTATAKEWFQQHQDQFVGHDRVRATSMVRGASDADEARSIADDVLAKAHAGALDETGVVDQSKLSLEGALNDLESRKIKDTGVYDQAKSRIVQMFDLSAKAHREVQADAMQQVVEHLTADNNPAHNLPYDVLSKLDATNKRKMEKVQADLRKDQVVKTDPETWADLSSMYRDPARWEEFLEHQPIEYVDRLSPVDYKRAADRYAEVQGKVQRRDTQLSQGQVSDQEVSRIWNENIGPLPPKPKTGEAPSPEYTAALQRQQRFADQLYRLVGAEQVKLKRDLTPPEIREQAAKLFAQTTWQRESEGFWDVLWGRGEASAVGPKRRVITQEGYEFESPGAEKRARSIRDLKDADRATYVEKVRKSGAIVTEQRVLDAYNADVTAAAIDAANAAP